MKPRIKTVAILTGLFLFVSLFWALIGNLLFDNKNRGDTKSGNSYFIKVTPILQVEQIDATIDYYKDILGFEVAIDHQVSDESIYTVLEKDNTQLIFQKAETSNIENRKDRPGNIIQLNFEIDNIEKYYQLISNKSKIIKDIQKTGNGKYEFTVEDINGYLLIFTEIKKN